MEPQIQWKFKRFTLCIPWITLVVLIFQQIQSSASQQICSSNEFQCDNSSMCIRDDWKCDNVNDCDDFSDESALTCCDDANHFHCGLKSCIPQSDVCNVVNDCGDNGDELNCPPPDMIFVTDIGNNDPKLLAGPIKTLDLEVIPVRDLQQPVGIDFDPVEHKVYWSDLGTRSINWAYIDGSDQGVVASSLTIPDDLALDTTKRWLFWTDRGSNKIEKVNLDGTRRRVVIDDDLVEPRAIVADMDESRLFWTDRGVSEPKIERANMDGGQRVPLITTDIVHPNGLTIDIAEKLLYWCDAYHNRIERANLNGNERVVMRAISRDIHPFDIGFYKDALYWSDESLRNLMKMIIDPRMNPSAVGPAIFNRAGGLHVHIYKQDLDVNECSSNPCVHGVCEYGVNGYSCQCASGWMGTICNIDINECISDPCKHGECVDGINKYTCECNPGWAGANCNNNVNQCYSSPCVNGQCWDGLNGYTCQCDAGWTDTRCNTNINECISDPCKHGECVDGINEYTCECNPGWAGANCNNNVNECNSSPCSDGLCVDGVNKYTCLCDAGWTGVNCYNNIDECASNPCQINGQCLDATNQYQCRCHAGWTGTHCENQVARPCTSSSCINGFCEESSEDYHCLCNAGWTGDNCNIEIRCDALTIPIDGTAFPPTCRGKTVPLGEECSIICNSGYTLGGSEMYMNCIQDGTRGRWTADSTGAVCHDLSAPEFMTCPESITVNLPANSSEARVTWSTPTVSHLGQPVTVVPSGLTSPALLEPGNYRVVYRAHNPYDGETVYCVFNVSVSDNMPPTFQTKCPLIIMNVTVQKPCISEIALYVNIPTPTDNSGFIPQVTPRIPYDTRLSIGRHERLFTATDKAGNVAECSVIFMVSKLTCEPLPPTPTNGFIDTSICDVDGDNFYNNVTTYKCNDGYKLVGNSTLTCGEDGKWKWQDEDGEWRQDAPKCEEIRCNPLTIPTYGSAFPDTCMMNDTASLGTSCFIFCDVGYQLYGSDRQVNCIQNGTIGSWVVYSTGAVCQDINAPTFETCPKIIEVNLPEEAINVSVTWLTPEASHSGHPVEAVLNTDVTSPAAVPDMFPVFLEAGTYTVVYEAHNPYRGQTGYCEFDIIVSDIHAPTFDCPAEPVSIESSGIPVVVTWEEPRVTDNVGVANLTRRYTDRFGNSHNISTLPFLLYYYDPVTVIYTAFDDAGNRAECSFEVEPTNSSQCSCPTMIDPPNSVLTCEASDCMNCSIYCTSEATVQLDTRFTNAECKPGGVKPSKPPSKYSDLLGKHPIKDVGVVGGKEDRNPQMAACATVDPSDGMNVSRVDVIVLNGSAEVDCSQQLSDNMTKTMTEGANAKFQAKCQTDSMSTCKVYIDEVECSDKSDSRRRKRQSESGVKLKVTCRLTAERSISDDIAVVDSAMSTTLSEFMPEGRVVLQNQYGQDNIFVVESVEYGPVKTNCRYRHKGAAGLRCVDCPLGTNFDLVRRECIPCTIGKYQDEEGWLVCKPCPTGTSTAGTGSYDVAHCQAACFPGEYAYLGLQPCDLCPIGTFQPEGGQRGCEPCPDGKTTRYTGATSVLQCFG